MNEESLVKRLLDEGERFYNLNRYEEALIVYERVIRLDPKNINAYNEKGINLRCLKRYKEALAAHERAIYLAPND